MLFNSLTFVVFFVVVVALYWSIHSWQARKNLLVVASYIFYGAWNPPFAALLFGTTAMDFWLGRRMAKAKDQHSRRRWLVASVCMNLSMLGFFKYGNFLLQNFQWLLARVGIIYQPPHLDILLPVGISFYTFATLSYTLDIYLRRALPARNFLDYALFVTFFPHLVAGPIMRPTELVPQFAAPRRATADQLRFGLALITLGLFNKIVLADSFLATAAERIYDSDKLPGALDAWIGTLAFSGQIFCDFAGYSTTAIGVALCLGFAMPDNFRFPYAAVGFSDFWRRWHITLSSWLRDYLYIPLGGNRHGAARTYAALMGTMLLGGLWHGANWTFVAWGGLHGLYLAVERVLRAKFAGYRPGPLMFVALGLLTYMLINLTWVFFRAKTFGKAWDVLRGMLGLNAAAKPILTTYFIVSVSVITGCIVLSHWLMRARTLESVVSRAPAFAVSLVWALMAFAIVIAQGSGNAFIYFQF